MTINTLNPDQSNIIINSDIAEAVTNWALDCWENYDAEADDIREEIQSWSDARIERFVNANYDGGMEQFIIDGGYHIEYPGFYNI